MISIQVIKLLDIVGVDSIQNAPGITPRTLLLKGKDFRSVEEVRIHGFRAPEFVVVDTTTLLAQVPDNLIGETIYDVIVLSSNFTLTDRSFIELGLGTRVKKVSGILRLMQVFMRMLLRTPGSNIFHPRLGGGILKSVGQNITDGSVADIAVAIRKTTSDIIARQSQVREIPPSERLLSAEISNFYADQPTGTVFATITLQNHSGQSAAATISA